MGDTLHVHTFGPEDGRPVLVLHGVTGHGGRFRDLAANQLPEFRVIAPDLRGHGRSDRLPPWTLEQHAVDLLSLLDTEGHQPIPVIGHSYGGLIAIYLARLAPQRISKLVLLDPAVSVNPELAADYAESAALVVADRDAAVAAQRADWPTVADEVVEAEVDANWVGAEDGWRPRYSPAAVATAWSEMCRATQLPPPGTPTLLVPALQEEYVSPEFVKACRYVLGTSLEVTGLNSGHMLYLDRPDDIGTMIKDFLA